MLEVPGKMPIMHRTCGGAPECGRLFAMDEAVRRKGKESAPGGLCGHPVILHGNMCAWRGSAGARGIKRLTLCGGRL